MEIKSLPDGCFRRYFWIDKKLEVNIWIRKNKARLRKNKTRIRKNKIIDVIIVKRDN